LIDIPNTIVKDNVLRTADHGYDRFLQLFQIFEAGLGLDFGAPLDPSEATTIIKDNEISFNAGAACDVFYLAGTNDSLIKDNEIGGYGPDILWLEASTGNLFEDNDTEDFTSSDVDFFADASSFDNKTYLKEGQTYFDEVPGNNIWIYDD
jgi:hypothetical protein